MLVSFNKQKIQVAERLQNPHDILKPIDRKFHDNDPVGIDIASIRVFVSLIKDDGSDKLLVLVASDGSPACAPGRRKVSDEIVLTLVAGKRIPEAAGWA